jgi:hypothetical protein
MKLLASNFSNWKGKKNRESSKNGRKENVSK